MCDIIHEFIIAHVNTSWFCVWPLTRLMISDGIVWMKAKSMKHVDLKYCITSINYIFILNRSTILYKNVVLNIYVCMLQMIFQMTCQDIDISHRLSDQLHQLINVYKYIITTFLKENLQIKRRAPKTALI